MRKEVKKKQPNNNGIEREKRLVMWSGVIFFMVLILAVWIFNIKKTFRQVATQNPQEFNWKEVQGEFSKIVNQAKENFSELKSAVKTNTATSAEQVSQSNIDELRKKQEARSKK